MSTWTININLPNPPSDGANASPEILAALAEIKGMVAEVRTQSTQTATQTQGALSQMAVDLTALQSAVEMSTSVEESAITLIQQIAAQVATLATNQVDPAALQAFSDELTSKASALAEAVSANTPATPDTPPTDTPPVDTPPVDQPPADVPPSDQPPV